jgi:predicted dehydrogenase
LFYAPALRTLEAAGVLRVVTLVDPSASALARLHAAFPAAQAVTALEGSGAPRDSLAIIASPPRWHADHTVAAVARGWHVLCEKPIAADSADAARMIDSADAAGRLLAIGHYKRFFPSSLTLKTLCAPGGALGALRGFSIAEGGPFDWPAASPSFFRRAETPGGVLLDIGVHVFDLLLWWLGAPDDFSYADDAMGGLEANARVNLRFGAVTGTVLLSRDWATPQRYEFVFERGRVGWTVNDANGLDLALDGAAWALQGTLRDAGHAPAATNAQSFIAQLRHVAGAITHRTPLLVDGREGVRALHLIEACYARRRLLDQPWFTPDETAAARRHAVHA